MENQNFQLLHKYKVLFDTNTELMRKIRKQQSGLLLKIIGKDDDTFSMITNVCAVYFNRNPNTIKIKRRVVKAVEMRELFSFMAYLYFDYSSEKISKYLILSRSMIHHYCEKIIDQYLMYKSFKADILTLFTEDEMVEMISKFSDKKRITNG
jgi:hypothetical protein